MTPPLQTTNLHRLEVERDDDGEVTAVRFVCAGGDDAPCHHYPNCECETVASHVDEQGRVRPGHEDVPQGECWALPWFDGGAYHLGDWVDLYDGPEDVATTDDLRSGPVTVQFDGDGVTFRYDEPVGAELTEALFDVEPTVLRHARISDCGAYRYELSRRWDVSRPAVTFVMLNPSTADGHSDDPTIRRCMGFARAWGFGAVWVVNLYAFRATEPAELRRCADPVGPDNDDTLARYGRLAIDHGTPLVAAWGAHAEPARVERVLQLDGFDRLQALGVTKAGQPRHPLYLRADAQLAPWPGGDQRG